MPLSLRSVFITLIVAFYGLGSWAGVSGCGTTGGDGAGAGGGGVGTGTGDADADALKTLDAILVVASTSLNVSSFGTLNLDTAGTKAQTVNQHVHCSNGSQAVVSGSNSAGGAGVFDILIDMSGCEGVSGSVGFRGTSITGAATRDFTGTFSSDAGGNGCSVSLGAVRYVFSVPLDVIKAPTSELLTGSLSATCTEPGGEASVACDFGGGVDPDNSSSLASSCSCTGAGC